MHERFENWSHINLLVIPVIFFDNRDAFTSSDWMENVEIEKKKEVWKMCPVLREFSAIKTFFFHSQ